MNISYHDARHILELKDVPATQKALLFALLSYMHPGTKRIYPTISTLSNELGCSESTLMRAMKSLDKAGHLKIHKEMFGGRLCNNYVIPFSDGYNYNSDQNDPSIPPPTKKAPKARPASASSPTKKSAPEGAAQLFEHFWNVYPRKAGKVAAEAAFMKCIKGMSEEDATKLVEQMIRAVRFQARSAQWHEGDRYIPHPSNWLNQHRWEDEPSLSPEEAASRAQEDSFAEINRQMTEFSRRLANGDMSALDDFRQAQEKSQKRSAP